MENWINDPWFLKKKKKKKKSGVPYGYLKYGAKANTSAHGSNEAWITELMTLDFEKQKKKWGEARC